MSPYKQNTQHKNSAQKKTSSTKASRLRQPYLQHPSSPILFIASPFVASYSISNLPPQDRRRHLVLFTATRAGPNIFD
jgi:hypothetical protein